MTKKVFSAKLRRVSQTARHVQLIIDAKRHAID